MRPQGYVDNPLSWIDPLGLAACDNTSDRKYWTANPVLFEGNKVYQRNDLFNPNQMTVWKDKGKLIRGTNIERMEAGRAPIGHDGKAINLHHMLQAQKGPIAEMSQSFHKVNHKIIHINPSTTPSGINRVEFSSWRKQYWINRAGELQ